MGFHSFRYLNCTCLLINKPNKSKTSHDEHAQVNNYPKDIPDWLTLEGKVGIKTSICFRYLIKKVCDDFSRKSFKTIKLNANTHCL